jgi:sigma-E factor negative regulatory protein RseB
VLFLTVMFRRSSWIVLFLASNLVYAAPQPEALLAALSRSLNHQAYSGDFTVEYGSKMESFHISRTLQDGEMEETLYRLTGSEHEFLRRGQSGCTTLGDKLLSGASVRAFDGSVSDLQKHYSQVLIGKERVAGRPAWILQLSPRDDYRFGMTLAVDVETQLLTRYVVYDAQKRTALERMQFVSLNIDEGRQHGASRDSSMEIRTEQCLGQDGLQVDERSPWQPSWLPPGFLLTAYVSHPRYGHVETYTDGLSSFSIFAKSGAGVKGVHDEIQQGASTRGAVMALMTVIPMKTDTLYVSVLGEIPLSTAQKVSLSLAAHSGDEEEGS